MPLKYFIIIILFLMLCSVGVLFVAGSQTKSNNNNYTGAAFVLLPMLIFPIISLYLVFKHTNYNSNNDNNKQTVFYEFKNNENEKITKEKKIANHIEELKNKNEKEFEKIILKPKQIEEHFDTLQVCGDGNCLFNALSKHATGGEHHANELRADAMKQILATDYEEGIFINPDTGEVETKEEYVKRMSKPGEWGTDIELNAIGKNKNIKIIVAEGREADKIIKQPHYVLYLRGDTKSKDVQFLKLKNSHYTLLSPKSIY